MLIKLYDSVFIFVIVPTLSFIPIAGMYPVHEQILSSVAQR